MCYAGVESGFTGQSMYLETLMHLDPCCVCYSSFGIGTPLWCLITELHASSARDLTVPKPFRSHLAWKACFSLHLSHQARCIFQKPWLNAMSVQMFSATVRLSPVVGALVTSWGDRGSQKVGTSLPSNAKSQTKRETNISMLPFCFASTV